VDGQLVQENAKIYTAMETRECKRLARRRDKNKEQQ